MDHDQQRELRDDDASATPSDQVSSSSGLGGTADMGPTAESSGGSDMAPTAELGGASDMRDSAGLADTSDMGESSGLGGSSGMSGASDSSGTGASGGLSGSFGTAGMGGTSGMGAALDEPDASSGMEDAANATGGGSQYGQEQGSPSSGAAQPSLTTNSGAGGWNDRSEAERDRFGDEGAASPFGVVSEMGADRGGDGDLSGDPANRQSDPTDQER